MRGVVAVVAAVCVLCCIGSVRSESAEVVWGGPIGSGGGYSTEAFNLLAGLESASAGRGVGTVVGTYQHGDAYSESYVRGLSDEAQESLSKWIGVGREIGRKIASSSSASSSRVIQICHSEPGAWAVTDKGALFSTSVCPHPGADYKIGRTMFETDRIPSGWAERCNAMDEIWVPTQFARNVFVAGGVEPDKVFVVPESVDTAAFDPESEAAQAEFELPGGRDGDTRFVSVFKWEDRKGWRLLLDAYFEAFTRVDPVSLYIVTRAFHSSEDFEAAIMAHAEESGRNVGMLPRVFVISDVPQAQMAAMYAAMDAFVLPSHGEGWGRPHTEAMAMGLPVIATAWSGPTEFMTADNSIPIPNQGLIKVGGTGPFAEHMWANPQLDAIVAALRLVAEAPGHAQALGTAGRATMVQHYSNDVIGEVLADHIDRIMGKLTGADEHAEL